MRGMDFCNKDILITFLFCVGLFLLFGTTHGDLNTIKERKSNDLSNNIGHNATSSVITSESRDNTELGKGRNSDISYERPTSSRRDSQRRRSKNGRRGRGNRKNGRKRKNNARNRDTKDINEVLRNTMRHMFGFEHIPVTTPPFVQIPQRVDPDLDLTDSHTDKNDVKSSAVTENGDMMPQPPDFMLELYRTYSRDNNLMMLHSMSQGNTVRSFFPAPADPRERSKIRKAVTITPVDVEQTAITHRSQSPFPVFLFNLSSIPSPESLVRAEIRLDGMVKTELFKNQHDNDKSTNGTFKKTPSLRDWNIIVGVYKIDSNDCADGLDCSVSQKIFHRLGNTTALDTDDVATWSARALLRLTTEARNRNHFLIVKFQNAAETGLSRPSRHVEKDKSNENANALPLQFMIRDNERLKRDSDGTRNNLHSSGSTSRDRWLDADFDHSPGTPILIIYCNDSRSAIVKNTPSSAPSIIWKRLENITHMIKKRVRRSDPDDLPSDEVENNHVDNEHESSNHASQRTQRDSQKNAPQVVEKHDSEKQFEMRKGKNVTKIRNTISNEKQNRKRKRKCNGKKKGKRGCKKSSKGKKKHKEVPLHPTAVERTEGCSRKSMNVDFASIGWSEWIISPTTFEAYYCSGRCELSNMQKTGTTNHAIIQEIARINGANVPAPCCVPDKLMPLSVLFFDENSNVVLKVYPNMSVETCACK